MTESRSGDIFQPGDLLNNTYRVEEILGRGGTSEVYRARSEISGRVVAVKALRSEYAANEDFLVLMTREEDIREVRHDAIVRYYDNQRTADGVVYLVMDYVEGPGLDARMKAGPVPADELMTLGARVLEGLVVAHDHGIVHRDLSPDNVILAGGAAERAVIIDFGIAKDTNPGAATIVGNEFAGKYAYAAPEQLEGRTDARSDIYALGASLLAAFRGTRPDVGVNPMEVIRRKAEPVDVAGVPEPLGGLIARMCAPDPEARFQTAVGALAAFRAAEAGTPGDVPSDATVIAAPPPRPAERASPPPPRAAAPKPAPEAPPRRRAPLLAGLAVVAAGAAAAAFVLPGLLAPPEPVVPVEPRLLVERQAAGEDVVAAGAVPTAAAVVALEDAVAEAGGTATVELANQPVPEGWAEAMAPLARAGFVLDSFRLEAEPGTVLLSGRAPDEATRAFARTAFETALPEGVEGITDIAVGPLFLPPDALRPVIAAFEDCGPLRLAGPPATGYGPGAEIVIDGRISTAEGAEVLADAVAAVAGDRAVAFRGEILSPPLCEIEAALPAAGPGGFEVVLSQGDGRPQEDGVFLVGDNPVIDVVLPEGVTDGELYASIVLPLQDLVIHLLPNRSRPGNDVASLRAEAGADGAVRVAHEVDENGAGRGGLGFRVDESALGDALVVVIHAEGPLFGALRPTTESVASYADALRAAKLSGVARVRSLDTRILTTATR